MTNPFDVASFDFAAVLAARKAEFGDATMAYADPPANASDNVSPVTASQDPTTKVTGVGARTSGLPTGSDGVDLLVTKAYNLKAYGPLRRRLVFDQFATVRPSMDSHNGAVVQLTRVNDIADDDPSTALLNEYYDVLPTPITGHPANVILNEYGRAVTKTALLRGTSMIPFDPIAAERCGRNMGATLDRLARTTVLAAGGIKIDGTAGAIPVDHTGTTVSASNQLRAVAEYFEGNDVEPFEDGFYAAVISPAAHTQLKKESGADGWRYYAINQNPGGGQGASVARGYIGEYEGFRFFVVNGISSTGGIFFGAEGLAKAQSVVPGYGDPQVVVSPVVDRLKRFTSIGWYWLGGYARFRAEAIATSNLSDIS